MGLGQIHQGLILMIEDQKESQMMMRPGTKKDQEIKREGLQMTEDLPEEVRTAPITKGAIQYKEAEEKSGAQERKPE
jgi:hypothetical protein